MKRCLLALLAVFVLLAPTSLAQQTVPELPFDSVPDFLKLPPGMNFGEVPGVAVDSKGNVYVFTRNTGAATGVPSSGNAFGSTAAQLLEFNAKGEFMREIGKGLYAWAFAHSVRIDKEDNIWAVDVGSNMVVKLNQAGRVLRVFGRKPEAHSEGARPVERTNPPAPPVDGLFRLPTDVAFDSKGNTYITDGYVNSRVAKYDKDGAWVMTWGTPGTGEGQFRLPHAVAIDRNDNVYIGDRSNHRVQVFDTEGKFLRMFSVNVPVPPGTRPVYGDIPTGEALTQAIGAPQALCITPGPNQVMFLGESTFPGRLFKVTLEGKVLGVIGKAGPRLKEFSGIHGLACPSENEVYVAENANWRVQKLLLRAQSTTTSANR